MKVIKGNKIVDLSVAEFDMLCLKFQKIVVDLGTGDGRFVYKSALTEPNTLFIGVDPAPKQIEEYARKVSRKKIENILFIIGSFELLPTELRACADKLYINLPWGSLLKAVAEPTKKDLEIITSLLKHNAEVEIIFGYASELEPTLTNRLQLDKIDVNKIIQRFEHNGFKLLRSSALSSSELRDIESTWGKRISTTSERKILKLILQIQ